VRTRLLAVSLLLLACTEPTRDPVAEVRALLDTLVSAVEGHDPATILSHVAFDFRADDGLGYADVQSVVMEYLIPRTSVGARLESVDIVPGENAGEIEARTRVRFARGTLLSGHDLPPPPGSTTYVIDLWFRLYEGGWKAVRARYRLAGEAAPSPSSGGPMTTPGDSPA
jgi:hypothetical protein